MLKSTEEAESHRLMIDRGVDLVVICPGKADFFREVGKSDKTLFARLEGVREPVWLHPLIFPDSLQTGFRVFEVIDG